MASAEFATAVLHNGLGNYTTALAAAQQACEHDELGSGVWVLPELIEAAVRSRRDEAAAVALHQLSERTHLSGSPWARGIEARSRALMAGRQAAEDLYQEAISQLSRSRNRTSRPRSSHLRRMAAPREPAPRRPRATAHRTPDARLQGSRRLR